MDQLQCESLAKFRNAFDASFWSTIPAIQGSVAACHLLNEAGYELVCATALAKKYQKGRLHNLTQLGFPIETVFTVEHTESTVSPKAEIIHSHKPVALVDDYLPYMLGIHGDIHRALITRETEGSANTRELLNAVSSQHTDLQGFATYWLGA